MRNSMEVRLLKRLLAQGDGAALFTYLFATEWGYPPSDGTQAAVDTTHEYGALARCWFNEAAAVEWEAAEMAKAVTKDVESHVERNLGEMLQPERMMN